MFEFESSLSPPPLLVLSLLIHLSPRANVYHLLPTLMGRMPSRSTPRCLPSSHLSHPHPLTPSSSSLASITISLGSSPQERVSISLPLPLALPVPSSYLRGGFFFFSPPPPPRHSGMSVPPPRLKHLSTSMPAQLRRQIRYVQYFIFLMTLTLTLFRAHDAHAHGTPDTLARR